MTFRAQDRNRRALAAAATCAPGTRCASRALGKNGQLTALLQGASARRRPSSARNAAPALNRLKDELTDIIEARQAALEEAALDARLAAERMDVTLPPPPRARRADPPDQPHHGGDRRPSSAPWASASPKAPISRATGTISARSTSRATTRPAPTTTRSICPPGRRPPPAAAHPYLARCRSAPCCRSQPPIRVIVPGRTYRADHDATHSPMFHQVRGAGDRPRHHARPSQGLPDRLPARLLRHRRPAGALPRQLLPVHRALDGSGYRLEPPHRRARGGGDWLEILGSGMVHPRVLANCGIDPREWQGFAFGMGVERITMLKHGMPDLRPFYESDIRWLRHYGFNPLAPDHAARGRLSDEVHPRLAEDAPRDRRPAGPDHRDADRHRPGGRGCGGPRRGPRRRSASRAWSRPRSTRTPTGCASARWMPATESCRSSAARRMRAPA